MLKLNISHKNGWGLNWAWDAFANGGVNPADTLYGVTVAMAVDGLYRTYLLTGDRRYLETPTKALLDYADQHSVQEGIFYFHYSDKAADQGYRVANITAMLMVQYDTIGFASNNVRLIDLANQAYQGLMADAKYSEQGMHWRYSGNAAKPRGNDLIHAAFIVYGLYRYCEAKGHDAESRGILEQAVAYLDGFVADGKVWEFHVVEKPIPKNVRARSWAVGMLLVAKLVGKTGLVTQAQAVIPEYEFSPGQFSYRYGDALHSPRAVAFLLLGAA